MQRCGDSCEPADRRDPSDLTTRETRRGGSGHRHLGPRAHHTSGATITRGLARIFPVMAVTEVRKKVMAMLGRARPGRMILGCSYGPDSLVLADVVLSTRAADTTLVYVDHGLRPEAGSE